MSAPGKSMEILKIEDVFCGLPELHGLPRDSVCEKGGFKTLKLYSILAGERSK